jgi:large repetitive protein
VGQYIINPGSISGNTSITVINNIAAGTYNFNVTNSFGCTSSNTTHITINPVLGAPLAPFVVVSQPTCSVATGSIFVSSADPNLLYSLDGGTFTAYPVGGYTGVAPGNHSLIAKQIIGGCFSPFTIITINTQPLSPSAPILNITQPNCTNTTGIITVISDTAALTFSFNGAAYSSYPINGYTANAGTHTLTVQNSSGCAPTILNNIIINPQPQTPIINALASPITCFGDYSAITVSATGGVLPYKFSINDTIFQNSNTFIVPAGFYKIFVKDSIGCSNRTDTIFLTQPLPITGSVVASPIACFGDSSILTITATGGLGTYEYSLDNNFYQTINSFKVPAGEYKVDIRLLNNPACYAAIKPQITITEPQELKILASYDAIKYCGDSTMIRISANGGKLPYTGLIGDFIKGPGVWTFSIIDSNGCSAITNITLLPPGCLELNLYPNPTVNNIIKIDHSAAINTGAYIQIFADNGAKLISQEVPENTFYSAIDVSGLKGGVYMLVYVNGNETKVAKFTKLSN